MAFLFRASRNICSAGQRRQVVIGRLSVAPPVICRQLEELEAKSEPANGERENTEHGTTTASKERRASVGRPALVVCGYLAENGERCVGFDREVCDRGCVTERVIASASV